MVETEEAGETGPSAARRMMEARFGAPIVDVDKIVAFRLPDDREVALQLDVAGLQVWLEALDRSAFPAGADVKDYAAETSRHSNLPQRLKHQPKKGLRPRAVQLVKVRSLPDLEAVLDAYAAADGINRGELNRLKALFLARYPDFEPDGFARREGGYFEEERRYKDELIRLAQPLRETAAGDGAEAAGARLLDILTGKAGAESGLLGWRTDGHVQSIRSRAPGQLERAAGQLLRASDLDAAIFAFIDTAWPLLAEGQSSMPYAETRNLPTMLSALVSPQDAYGINTTPVSDTCRRLIGRNPLANGPMTPDEYAAVKRLMLALMRIMEAEWHWAPRDLWDVQGFIWAVNRADQPNLQHNDADTDQGTEAVTVNAKNIILYGPPGTGKTYATAAEAVALCDGSSPANREELMARYRALADAGQIAFVTFHQSYAYEDFVEGLRPQTPTSEDDVPSAGFQLVAKSGIFRELAKVAEQARKAGGGREFDMRGRQVFKMSLGRPGIENHVYDEALEEGFIALSRGGETDWSDPRFASWNAILEKLKETKPDTTGYSGDMVQTWCFRNAMREKDLVVVSDGLGFFKAVGEIEGPYRYEAERTPEYRHRRSVRWLLQLDDSLPVDTISNRPFSGQSCYKINDVYLKREALARLLAPRDNAAPADPDQFVLIIDEINRANISKVFGELITLLEPDKRLGSPNELKVKLPYSG